MSKTLKKIVVAFTTVTTVLTMSGVVLLAPISVSAATVVDGDLVRNPNAEGMAQFDIYIVKIVGSKKFKRLILSPHVFESYAHFDKNGNGSPWDDVMDVDQATMDSLTLSELVRADGDTKVYKLVATPGSDTGTKEWLNMTAEEFGASYDWDSIYTINTTDRDAYNAGSDISAGAGEEEEVVVSSTGTLTASLAADTPATSIVVTNAARVPFTKINLTATGGDVIVDSMTIKRGGTAAQDGAFSSIAVILDSEDGDQLGNNKTLNSVHKTTLNDDLTIMSGETRSIYLAGNMGNISTTYAGEVPQLVLEDIVLKDSATLNANLPIQGNPMSLNGTVTIGTATIVAGGNAPSASTQNVGITNYTVSAVKITANSAEPITVKKMVFTQNGSASYSDVENVKLINANTGEVLETIAAPTSKTITFNPNVTIGKGKNVSFDLRLDIVNGSGRAISYDIDEDTDILVKGDTYGYFVTPTYTGVSSRPYYPAPDTTIGDGTLRIESVAISPTNIAEDVDAVVLGKFKFVAKGEEVKITSIGWHTHLTYADTANNAATTSDITNITIYDENDSVVAGPMDPTYDNGDSDEDYGSATTTDTIVVPIGETIYTVKADLSEDFLVNDKVQIQILPSIIVARGMTTDNSITPTPSSWISSTNMTIKVADLNVSVGSSPTSQTVVAGTQDFIFSKILLDATDSGSDVKVTQIKPAVKCGDQAYPDLVSGMELYDGDTLISVDSNSWTYDTAATTAGTNATNTINLSTGALVLSAGTSKVITIKADIGTGLTIADANDTLKVGVHGGGVVATDADGNAITEDITGGDGSTMTLSSGGTLFLSGLTDPKSALVVAGTSGVSVGRFTLLAKYEDITISQIGITLAAPDGPVDPSNEYDQVASLALYEDGVATAIGSLSDVSAANATITPTASLVLPAGTTKSYTLKATFAPLNDTSPAESGAGVKFKVTSFEATGDSPGSTSITKTGLDATFNNFSIAKSLPTVEPIAFSGDNVITSNGEVSLYKLKITADGAGPVGLYKLTFGITTTTVTIINDRNGTGKDTTGFYLYESDSATSLGDVISQGSTEGLGDMVGVTTTAAGNYLLEVYFDEDNDAAHGRELKILTANQTKYYTLRGTIATGHDGTVDNESITTVLAGDASFSHTALASANDIDTKDQDDFIWTDLNDDQYATSTATNTAMFLGGYRVPGMPNASTTGQVITD